MAGHVTTLSQRKGHLFLIVTETLPFVLCSPGRWHTGAGGNRDSSEWRGQLKLPSRKKEEERGRHRVVLEPDSGDDLEERVPWRSEKNRPGQCGTPWLEERFLKTGEGGV